MFFFFFFLFNFPSGFRKRETELLKRFPSHLFILQGQKHTRENAVVLTPNANSALSQIKS